MSKYLNVMYQSNKLLSKIHSITYLDKESGLNLEFLDSLEFLTRTQSQRKVDSPSTHFFLFPALFRTVRSSHIHTWKLQNAYPSPVYIRLQTTTHWPPVELAMLATLEKTDQSTRALKMGREFQSWVPRLCSL